MIYTVSFNPSLDYVQDVPSLQLGCVNRTTAEKILPGGKGINTSIVLKNLGFDNKALGFIAGFTGMELQTILCEIGVNTDFIVLPDGMTRINVKIRGEQETEINSQGPNILAQDIEALYRQLEALQAQDILVLSGNIPDCMPKETYMDIMKKLEQKQIHIVVDATKDLLMNVLPYHPFLIKPNHHELGEIFGVTMKQKEDVIVYGKKLQEMGAENVLVSMAGAGAVLIAKDGTVYQSDAPKGTVVNSVGAGDSMVAGFLAGYLQEVQTKGEEQITYEQAFQMGVCTGSASAFSEDLATREEVDTLLKTHFGK